MEDLISTIVGNGINGVLAVAVFRLINTLNGFETRLQILEKDDEDAAKEQEYTRGKFLKVYELFSKISEKISKLRTDVDVAKNACEIKHGAKQ